MYWWQRVQCLLQVTYRTFSPNIVLRWESFYHVSSKTLSETAIWISVRSECLEIIHLGCLPYGILTVKDRVTCITNEVISSRHDCVFQAYFCEFDSPIKQANCKAYTQYCPLHPDNTCLYKYCIPYRNLTACLHTQNVIVNYVSKISLLA